MQSIIDLIYMYTDFFLFSTHFSLETHKRVIGKQCRPRSDMPNVASDQSLHCLQTI